MSPIQYIMIAGMIISVFLGAYIFLLGRRQNQIMRRLQKLEILKDE